MEIEEDSEAEEVLVEVSEELQEVDVVLEVGEVDFESVIIIVI